MCMPTRKPLKIKPRWKSRVSDDPAPVTRVGKERSAPAKNFRPFVPNLRRFALNRRRSKANRGRSRAKGVWSRADRGWFGAEGRRLKPSRPRSGANRRRFRTKGGGFRTNRPRSKANVPRLTIHPQPPKSHYCGQPLEVRQLGHGFMAASSYVIPRLPASLQIRLPGCWFCRGIR